MSTLKGDVMSCNEQPKYRMTVDLNVLDHLGVNLYSNIAAVLTETVANAWDADARNVTIILDKEANAIKISDDGIGMSVEDINEKYLRIGYKKRSQQDKTMSNRPVMGRKGLGKLSLFSIAKIVEVCSAKDGTSHGLRMNIDDIRAALDSNQLLYAPVPIADGEVHIETGTSILLKEITKPNIYDSIEVLRTQLARRFSIIGEAYGFKVSLNGVPISINDREELTKAQFVWRIGGNAIALPVNHNVQKESKIDVPFGAGYSQIKGWIATSHKPKDLATKAGNLNGIVVISRGRLIQENILDKLNDGRMYTKYLTGQIEADALDDTGSRDIATSDRQRLQEDDHRYVALLNTLRWVLSQIEAEWSELRSKFEVEKITTSIPAVAEWLASMPQGFKKTAEKLVSQISVIHVEKPEQRKTLLRHGILAFERIKLNGAVDDLVQGLTNIEQMLKILADRDSLEASLYRDIIKSRLEVIKSFEGLLDAGKKEAVLQRYLFNHLWLLDPMWDRATDSERVEQALKKEYKEFTSDLTEEESKGRLDIRYKTNAGAHIIVELKRYNRKLSLPELQEQGQKYKSALSKCLKNAGETNPDIQIVFVLGKVVREAENAELGDSYVRNTLTQLGARIVYYEQMIRNANSAYSEYLARSKKLDKLDGIIDQIPSEV